MKGYVIHPHISFSLLEKVKFVLKQMVHHGRNLGLFVGTYKTICYLLRSIGVSGGVESWIAGFIGGFTMFGNNKGISGSVNHQIVLYLFARGIYGSFVLWAERGYIPRFLDVRTAIGFRVLAGFSLALILYMTEYHPSRLQPSFMSTMNFLYYDSESATPQPFLPPYRFLPFFLLVSLSLLGEVYPSLSLESLLTKLLDWGSPSTPRTKPAGH